MNTSEATDTWHPYQDPYFGSPWDHADKAGIFHDQDGREWRAIDVGGELTFLPLLGPS